MTRRPQPLPFWRLVAVTGAVVAGFLLIDRMVEVPAPAWDGPAARLASAAAVLPEGEIASGRPVMSLVVDPDDLYDAEEGILANVNASGRDWERPGSVAFFDEGRLRFATGVGVRVHGGGSRQSSPRQGFRLYFRREYGMRQVPPNVLFSPEAEPIRHLVIHNDVRDELHFFNPLAYDLSRAVGAITPDTYPVRFFLNGEFFGVYVLTERFDEQYFEAHWDRPFGQVGGSDEAFADFWRWSVGARPMTYAALAERADVDNLLRWLLTVAFAATRDAYQGPSQYLDLGVTPPRWFWVNWDMDGSFRAWDLDSYQDLLNRVDEGQRGRSHTEPRGNLLSTLLAEDERFQTRYKQLFVAAMNHHLTPSFLDERLNHYRQVSARLGVADTQYLDELQDFFDRRPAFFWTTTEQWLNSGPSQLMAIRAPAGETITIDGEPAGDGFVGRYFPDLEMTLVARGNTGSTFREWRVNGQARGRDRELRLKVSEPLDVEAVFEGRSAASAARSLPGPPERPAIDPRAARLTWVKLPASDGLPEFSMLAHEVTVAAFEAFAARTGWRTPLQPSWFSAQDHPVVNVTWDEAQAFCEAQGGRLPTEEEFAMASERQGEGTPSPPWDDAMGRAANLLGTHGADRWEYTAPVGSFPPNRFGLHDLVGNVWEWTASPHPRTTDVYDERIVAGGSWDSPARSFPRLEGLSRIGRHNLYVGFRCVR